MTQFQTTAAYISGGICGPIWWPAGQICGRTLKADLRDRWSPSRAWEKGDTFRDWLLSLLTREGGDFQNATFTADTVIRIERRAIDAPGKYRVHVKELEIGKLADCADLVNGDVYTGDFFGDE